jgi:HAD superfamily hydrolase (TIGR01509 family)
LQTTEPDFKAVIFDMDGVIVDSEPRHERAFLEVVNEIGYGDTHGIHWPDYVGRSDHVLWEDFVARHNPPQPLAELMKMKRDRVTEILRREEPIFDGLAALVEKLARVCKLGLASGSERPVVEAVLSLQDLRRFFSTTVTAWDVKCGKPAPDIFLRTAELLDVPPEACWVIEDSKPGVAAGLAAGMKVMAITNSHPAAEFNNATHVVSSYKEIEQLLIPPQARTDFSPE